MQISSWTELDQEERDIALARPAAIVEESLINGVKAIMAQVRKKGDVAVKVFTQQFDGVEVDELRVAPQDLKLAWDKTDPKDQRAMQLAHDNIKAFHEAQRPAAIKIEVMPGVICTREPRPIPSAGLYVPGGTAPLVSTLMMLAIPARIAKVKKTVVITPPGPDGKVNQAVLACAYLCGIDDVFMAGGAQAIAALAYGTETIPKTAKIFGPGNAYVAAAKAIAAQEPGGPAIDLPAGPSEAMVICDDDANPVFAAADLLSQAEHDVLAQVLCVCRSEAFARRLNIEIEAQLSDLPREAIAAKSLQNGKILIADTQDEMVAIVNQYAPEHLIIQTANADDLVPDIENAGSIFLGKWTPEAVGDYASGTNHTLPTGGAARAYSGVVLESFMKFISVQKLSQQGLNSIGPAVERLATLEGLDAHRRAITVRMNEGKT